MVFPHRQGTKIVKTGLTGGIEVSPISVTLPSDDSEFQINPAVMLNVVDNPGGQVVCPGPESLKVISNLVVAIRLGIASVEAGDAVFEETFEGGLGHSFQLVNRMFRMDGFERVILVLERANRRYTSEMDFEQYTLHPGRTGIPATELKAGENAGPQFYGTAEADSCRGYQFTVKPILEINVIRTK